MTLARWLRGEACLRRLVLPVQYTKQARMSNDSVDEGLMVVGGYSPDLSIPFKENHVKVWLSAHMADIDDFWPVGKYHQLAKVQWKSSRKMLRFMKSNKDVAEMMEGSKMWWGREVS